MIRTAKTENGIVEGIEAADPRITAFKGIPFAAPPIGKNRWREPQPCENWNGIRQAYRFAPISVQDTPALGTDIYCREWHVDADIPMSEDCLYLNIWTSAKSIDEKQPVVVWFFGGMLQWGYTAEMEFDGERLARRGIVVVTVNYRLNVFGFLAHPELTAQQPDAPTNFGNLDQQAGLQWVIRNIGAFGGDKDNITIAGQSAGGGSVLSQMTCPSNFGLFQRAIVQSGVIRNPFTLGGVFGIPQPLEKAEQEGTDFFAFLGVKTLEEARTLEALYIRDMYAQYVKVHPRMFTVCDGRFCMGDPLTLIAHNKWANVPLLAGSTENEFIENFSFASKDELNEKANIYFGNNAAQFEHLISERTQYAVNSVECGTKTLFTAIEKSGSTVPCYYYQFDADIPGEDAPGSFHSSELWFFFETLAKCWRPFKGKHYDLARQMSNYWSNFVKCSNPNGLDADNTPMLEWKPYTQSVPFSMVFGKTGISSEHKNKPLEEFLIQYNSTKLTRKST